MQKIRQSRHDLIGFWTSHIHSQNRINGEYQSLLVSVSGLHSRLCGASNRWQPWWNMDENANRFSLTRAALRGYLQPVGVVPPQKGTYEHEQ